MANEKAVGIVKADATVKQLEDLAGRVFDVVNGLPPQVQIVVVAGALLAMIRAAMELPAPVPSDVLRLERFLDEVLIGGVPVVATPTSTAFRRMH